MEHDELLDQVADEMLQAIETKDKKMLLDALQALVLHITDADQEPQEMPDDEGQE